MKYVIFLLLIASCNTVAKQQRKAETFYNAYPEKLAKQCVDKFPVDTVYKEGETITKSDTVTIKGDSVACPPVVNEKGETVYVKAKCPDSKIIHDTTIRIDTLTKLDNAAIAYITGERNAFSKQVIQTTSERDDARKSAKNMLFWIIGLVIALTGSLYFNVKNKF